MTAPAPSPNDKSEAKCAKCGHTGFYAQPNGTCGYVDSEGGCECGRSHDAPAPEGAAVNIPNAPLPCLGCGGVLLDGNNLWLCENDDCMSDATEPKVVREVHALREEVENQKGRVIALLSALRGEQGIVLDDGTELHPCAERDAEKARADALAVEVERLKRGAAEWERINTAQAEQLGLAYDQSAEWKKAYNEALDWIAHGRKGEIPPPPKGSE